MASSVQVGLIEVYEGLRLFVTKDRLNKERIPVAFARDTEQTRDGDSKQIEASNLNQMQLM